MRLLLTMPVVLFIAINWFSFKDANQNNSDKYLKKDKIIKNEFKPNIKDSINYKDYIFKDTLNRDVKISDFRGKYVMIDIWYTGCGACISANMGLNQVHKTLNGKNIIFLSISTDKDRYKWLLSISKTEKPRVPYYLAGKYWPIEGTICLYTGGSGRNNSFMNLFIPQGFCPKLLFFDTNGVLISDNPPRPDHNPSILSDYLAQFL